MFVTVSREKIDDYFRLNFDMSSRSGLLIEYSGRRNFTTTVITAQHNNMTLLHAKPESTWFLKRTPERIHVTGNDYLRPENRESARADI